MRIKETRQIPIDQTRLAPIEDKRTAPGSQHSFQRHMRDTGASEYEQYISELQDKVRKQGEKLGKKVDVAEFQKYRELITQLFSEVAGNSYQFCKSDKFDQRGRHKVFAVIRNVNKKLDEIAAMILKDEADNIELLHAVDDVRGMLVDMFL